LVVFPDLLFIAFPLFFRLTADDFAALSVVVTVAAAAAVVAWAALSVLTSRDCLWQQVDDWASSDVSALHAT
jgi:hypothetical protein